MLLELITEARYRYQAALLTADMAKLCLDITNPESIEALCMAQQNLGAAKAELDVLTGQEVVDFFVDGSDCVVYEFPGSLK